MQTRKHNQHNHGNVRHESDERQKTNAHRSRGYEPEVEKEQTEGGVTEDQSDDEGPGGGGKQKGTMMKRRKKRKRRKGTGRKRTR